MVTVREASAADAWEIARVHIDAWRETYPGIVPDEYLAGLSYEGHAEFWTAALGDNADGQCAYLAEDEAGGAVGFAAGGPEHEGDPLYAGELYAVYVLQTYQRHGLGRRLLGAVAARLAGMGLDSMLVWALAGHPSCRFYEALGGHELRSAQTEMGGVTVDITAYGWTDTAMLARM